MSSPFATVPGQPAWVQPPPPPERPYAPGGIAMATAAAVDRETVLEGRVLGTFNQGPLCDLHFPAGPELTRLAVAARQGKPAAFVGTGHDYTPLSCACLAETGRFAGGQPWRLGDHLVHLSERCLRGAHAECRDKSCCCECQGLEARGAIEATEADRALAGVLGDLNRTLAAELGGRSITPAEADELVMLRKRLAELEAGQPAAELAQCTATSKRSQERCRARAAAGSDRCKAHAAGGD